MKKISGFTDIGRHLPQKSGVDLIVALHIFFINWADLLSLLHR